MYSYRDQLSLIEPIELRENETKRINCPFCVGSKSFSITRAEGNSSLHACYPRILLMLGQGATAWATEGVYIIYTWPLPEIRAVSMVTSSMLVSG